jgi:alkylation response protein AidB-like acyl-CoA dehydrogenase
VDLDFSEEQVMLRDTTRGICEQLVPGAVVREMENSESGFLPEFWQQISELGINGLGVAEAFGGMGWGSLEMAIVYEEFGRSLAPSPHFVSAVLSAKVIELAGTPEQQKSWLAKIPTGEVIITPAWIEPGNGFEAEGVQLQAKKTAKGYVLNGTKLMVPFARSATRLLVLARCEQDVIGVLVDPKAKGVKLAYEKNHSSENLFQVDFNNVEIASSDSMTKNFWQHWDEAMNIAVIALAAQAIGGAEAIHHMANEYAKQRVQFGKPIGSFMAIAHYLADLDVRIQGAKVLVYQAAWAKDQNAQGKNKPWKKLAAMAKLQACNVFRDAAATGVQIHGGFGFTTEGNPQLYFRRAKYQQVTYWDSNFLEQRIAAAVLEEVAA